MADEEVDLFILPAGQLPGPAAGGVPVIAHGPAALMRAAFLAGCADYLREPWTPEELALRAQAALSRRRACWDFPWGEARFEGDTLCAPGGSAAFPHSQAVLLRALLRRRGVDRPMIVHQPGKQVPVADFERVRPAAPDDVTDG